MPSKQQIDYSRGKARIEELIEFYSYLPFHIDNDRTCFPQQSPARKKVVLVTGTTGNVGSDLLYLLLNDERVGQVYALNRTSNHGSSPERIKKQLEDKGLPTDVLLSSKVTFIDGKLDAPDLGLEPAMFMELRKNVTTIIHNAWPVNLAQPLSYYELSIKGLHNLITFARGSPHGKHLRFLFVSSVATASMWIKHRGAELIPEVILQDPTTCIGMGYGESKYVAENILARSGLNATSLRFFQLCGRQADGVWVPSEWPVLILKASLLLGIKTDMVGRFPFLPTDIAAQCIRDITIESRPIPSVLNFVHPRPIIWQTLAHGIHHLFPKDRVCPEMYCWDFLDEVAKLVPSATRQDFRENPILHIIGQLQRHLGENQALLARAGLNTNEHFPHGTMSIDRALEFSPSLKGVRPISEGDVEGYVKYWQKIGFLPKNVDEGQIEKARL